MQIQMRSHLENISCAGKSHVMTTPTPIRAAILPKRTALRVNALILRFQIYRDTGDSAGRLSRLSAIASPYGCAFGVLEERHAPYRASAGNEVHTRYILGGGDW